MTDPTRHLLGVVEIQCYKVPNYFLEETVMYISCFTYTVIYVDKLK